MNKIIQQLNLDDDFLFAKVMRDGKKMLEKGMSIQDIRTITELSQEEIEAIHK